MNWMDFMGGSRADSPARSRGPECAGTCRGWSRSGWKRGRGHWLLARLQQAKGEAGLDHYQVRSWRAWHAHVTLSMLALAWLAVTRARAVKGEPGPATRA
jgi:hypothetical protein